MRMKPPILRSAVKSGLLNVIASPNTDHGDKFDENERPAIQIRTEIRARRMYLIGVSSRESFSEIWMEGILRSFPMAKNRSWEAPKEQMKPQKNRPKMAVMIRMPRVSKSVVPLVASENV